MDKENQRGPNTIRNMMFTGTLPIGILGGNIKQGLQDLGKGAKSVGKDIVGAATPSADLQNRYANATGSNQTQDLAGNNVKGVKGLTIPEQSPTVGEKGNVSVAPNTGYTHPSANPNAQPTIATGPNRNFRNNMVSTSRAHPNFARVEMGDRAFEYDENTKKMKMFTKNGPAQGFEVDPNSDSYRKTVNQISKARSSGSIQDNSQLEAKDRKQNAQGFKQIKNQPVQTKQQQSMDKQGTQALEGQIFNSTPQYPTNYSPVPQERVQQPPQQPAQQAQPQQPGVKTRQGGRSVYDGNQILSNIENYLGKIGMGGGLANPNPAFIQQAPKPQGPQAGMPATQQGSQPKGGTSPGIMTAGVKDRMGSSQPQQQTQAPAAQQQAPQGQQQQDGNYDSMNFNQAFGAARKSGAQEFTWKGKRYGTKLAGEVDKPAQQQIQRQQAPEQLKPAGINAPNAVRPINGVFGKQHVTDRMNGSGSANVNAPAAARPTPGLFGKSHNTERLTPSGNINAPQAATPNVSMNRPVRTPSSPQQVQDRMGQGQLNRQPLKFENKY